MNPQEQHVLQVLQQFFKALSDETRLRMVGLLSRRPHSVGELAEALELTEPTVSHHLGKLRELGLVNLRAAGNSRIYSLNSEMLERLTGLVLRLEEVMRETPLEKPDMGWVEALDLDEAERKVFKDYFYGTRLKQIPTKQKKLLVVLRWLADKFEPGVKYTEREVNAIIEQVHPDYATLRRELVDFHLLRREGGGGGYWRA